MPPFYLNCLSCLTLSAGLQAWRWWSFSSQQSAKSSFLTVVSYVWSLSGLEMLWLSQNHWLWVHCQENSQFSFFVSRLYAVAAMADLCSHAAWQFFANYRSLSWEYLWSWGFVTIGKGAADLETVLSQAILGCWGIFHFGLNCSCHRSFGSWREGCRFDCQDSRHKHAVE